MTPKPENLMKITGYAHSSDDEQSALSNINLVKAVDGLTETPGCRPEIFRTMSRARSKSESEVSEEDSISIKSIDDDVASNTSQDHGPYAPINDPIKPGDRVVVKNKYAGTCRYVGPIKEKRKSTESFVGIELDQKMTRFGGVFGSKKYFDCEFGYGIMVTFKNVTKLKKVIQQECFIEPSIPEIVEMAPFTKSTRTVSRKTYKSSRTSSHDSDDTHFDVKTLNDKGWRVSPGYEATKITKSSSLQHTRKPHQAGTMEILDNFKTMQEEFRSLPTYLNEINEMENTNYFDPSKFYKFKPFYYHEDLGPMRCNLGEKNTSIDCPNPEWDQMRQSFDLITKQKTISMQSGDSAYEGDPVMTKYYTSSSSRSSSRRSSEISQNHKQQKSSDNQPKEAPKVMPIRIRRYYEKETDSSGICDSDGSTGKKKHKAVVKCQDYAQVPITHDKSRRRSSKSSKSSKSFRSKSLTNCTRKISSPKALEMANRIVVNVKKSRPKKACCEQKETSKQERKESILKSFSILNRDCEADNSTCDDCGAAKLSDLGRIYKGNPHLQSETSERDTVALMSDTDSGGDSLEIDEVIIGFDHMSARTKSNQTTKDDYEVCVPNVCEKWAKKHGQELSSGMQKGLKKLEAALV